MFGEPSYPHQMFPASSKMPSVFSFNLHQKFEKWTLPSFKSNQLTAGTWWKNVVVKNTNTRRLIKDRQQLVCVISIDVYLLTEHFLNNDKKSHKDAVLSDLLQIYVRWSFGCASKCKVDHGFNSFERGTPSAVEGTELLTSGNIKATRDDGDTDAAIWVHILTR